MSDVALSLAGLEKAYNRGQAGEVVVLKGADLTVAAGDGQISTLQHHDLARLAAVIGLFDAVQDQRRITHSAAPRPGSSAPPGAPGRW